MLLVILSVHCILVGGNVKKRFLLSCQERFSYKVPTIGIYLKSPSFCSISCSSVNFTRLPSSVNTTPSRSPLLWQVNLFVAVAMLLLVIVVVDPLLHFDQDFDSTHHFFGYLSRTCCLSSCLVQHPWMLFNQSMDLILALITSTFETFV